MLHSRCYLLYINICLLKKFINNYKWAMLAQYLILQRATNSKKSKQRTDKVANFLQASKERKLNAPMLIKNLCIVVRKYILQ